MQLLYFNEGSKLVSISKRVSITVFNWRIFHQDRGRVVCSPRGAQDAFRLLHLAEENARL
jgi:hypothetical protein